jgi:hypothetical protein
MAEAVLSERVSLNQPGTDVLVWLTLEAGQVRTPAPTQTVADYCGGGAVCGSGLA